MYIRLLEVGGVVTEAHTIIQGKGEMFLQPLSRKAYQFSGTETVHG